MRKLVQISLILFISLTFSNCEKSDLIVDEEFNLVKNVNDNTYNNFDEITRSENWVWETYTSPSGSRYEIHTYRNCPRRPLIIAIHGGSFRSGDKSLIKPQNFNDLNGLTSKNGIDKSMLNTAKIAYATINYKLCNGSSVKLHNSLADIGAVIQDIRNHATDFNIDPNKIILLGQSAGSSASLYFGLWKNTGSSPVKGIVCFDTQSSLDVSRWKGEIFTGAAGQQFYNAKKGVLTADLVYDLYGTTNVSAIRSYSDVCGLHLINLIDERDPEIYLVNTKRTDLLHNLYHDNAIINMSDSKGHHITASKDTSETVVEFCKRKFSDN